MTEALNKSWADLKQMWLTYDEIGGPNAAHYYEIDGSVGWMRKDLVDGLVEALEMCVKHLDADGNLWSKEEQAMAIAALKALETNNE